MSFSLAFMMGFLIASMPGPILVLIATETLRKGPASGLLIVTAPPLIDALVMVPLALVVQSSFFSGQGAVTLGFIGCGLLVWLGLQSIWAAGSGLGVGVDRGAEPAWRHREIAPFLKGVLTQLTNPYPYLYWGTVGVSFIRRGFEREGAWGAAEFPLGFWAGAVTFSLLVVYLVAQGKRMMPARWDPLLHWLSGILLMGSGIFLAVMVWRGLF